LSYPFLFAYTIIGPSSVQASLVAFPKIQVSPSEIPEHSRNSNLMSSSSSRLPNDTLLSIKSALKKETKKNIIAEARIKEQKENTLTPGIFGLNYSSTDFSAVPSLSGQSTSSQLFFGKSLKDAFPSNSPKVTLNNTVEGGLRQERRRIRSAKL
jgi:hypothetical protein